MEGSTEDRQRLAPAATRADSRAPDIAGEILGWKVLALSEEGHLQHHLDQMHHVVIPTRLSSPMRDTLWPPRDWLHAVCRREAGHQPPEEDCRCGIYAMAEPGLVREYLREAPLTVLAQVGLAGKVIPGATGWRAERARILALTRAGVGFKDYPALFSQVAKRYGVPIIDLNMST